MSPRQLEPSESSAFPNFVHIVHQSLSDIPAIRPEAATLLANGAEYYIREVIHRSKKFMNHSKRSCLTTADIQLADKSRDQNPLFGYSSASPQPGFQPVQSCPGLYVTNDSIISLRDVLHAPIHLPPSPPYFIQTQTISPHANLLLPHDKSQKRVHHSAMESLASLLSSGQQHPQFSDTVLSNLCSAPILPLQQAVSILRDAVHQNARKSGNTSTLYNAMRVAIALSSRPSFGIDLFEDAMLPSILTCLLAPNLGTGHVVPLRELAAEALNIFLSNASDTFIRQRTCNTLVRALTDINASLSSIFGAISGFAEMGPQVFESVCMPYIPTLISALDEFVQAGNQSGRKCGDLVDADVTHVCLAIERCMRMSRLVEPDLPCIDVIL